MSGLIGFTSVGLSALIVFAIVSSITPGPNNLMLFYSGIRFGFQKTIPHLLGVSLGFGVMIILCCIGIGALFMEIPNAKLGLKIVGFFYMCWLAYLLWKNGAVPTHETLEATSKGQHKAKPMTFVQACLFQYVNPKAWVMGLSVPAAYLPASGSLPWNIGVAVFLFTIINLLCVSVWAKGGALMQELADKPSIARFVQWVIVLMTLYCAFAIWF